MNTSTLPPDARAAILASLGHTATQLPPPPECTPADVGMTPAEFAHPATTAMRAWLADAFANVPPRLRLRQLEAMIA